MAGTNVRDCSQCGYEGDCLEGLEKNICVECLVMNSAPVKAVDAVIKLLEGKK